MRGKQARLSGKDIQYMLRKGKKIYGDMFVCVMVPQHRHRRYTQRSIQIPIKLDKRATMRNLLKRFAREEFCEIFSSYKGMHMRLFIFVNKKTLASFKDTIATQKKTSIVNAWKTLCKKDFISFAERLGKHS